VKLEALAVACVKKKLYPLNPAAAVAFEVFAISV
jgi:hypothetical protein